MRFSIFLDLGRTSPDVSTSQVLEQTTELVELADAGGFEAVFCGEHHGHELTIAPNPMSLLAYWSNHVQRVRLGTAVVCAPYWHPVRLAGEAGLLDLITGGRFDLGIGRGAYTYEFARMAGGIPPETAREALGEMLPALRGLWAGDYEHKGEMWNFPSTTSTPRPQSPEGPPVWVSARHPDVFRLAVENRCNLMVTPLSMPFAEVESLAERRDVAVAEVGSGFVPEMMVLRNACVYADDSQREEPVRALLDNNRYFGSLFRTDGNVRSGWVQPVDPDEEPSVEETWENHVFGTPEQVVGKLREYERVGTDVFMYGSSYGLDHATEVRSLKLFIDEVMPAFAEGGSPA
jgi:alkanesulfonate monooxygenase SsuD/methylene tetrahydromethanopterin reductase-like flavin-dependent oxidoreductase (luciferase family)